MLRPAPAVRQTHLGRWKQAAYRNAREERDAGRRLSNTAEGEDEILWKAVAEHLHEILQQLQVLIWHLKQKDLTSSIQQELARYACQLGLGPPSPPRQGNTAVPASA